MEEIIVIRLEGLGTYALPAAALRPYRVLETDAVRGSGPRSGRELGAVPVILREDFLHAAMSRWDDLVVDGFGCVRRG